jgi:hypothetical protein
VERLLRDPHAGIGSIDAGARLIGHLVSQSFPGLVSDPVSNPECLESSNLAAVAQGIDRYAAHGADRCAAPGSGGVAAAAARRGPL